MIVASFSVKKMESRNWYANSWKSIETNGPRYCLLATKKEKLMEIPQHLVAGIVFKSNFKLVKLINHGKYYNHLSLFMQSFIWRHSKECIRRCDSSIYSNLLFFIHNLLTYQQLILGLWIINVLPFRCGLVYFN